MPDDRVDSRRRATDPAGLPATAMPEPAAGRAARSACVIAIGLAALFAHGLTAAAAEAPSVERLASLPHLTGLPPSSPVWSPDGARVAFLWNDRGGLFRDVWIASADSAEPRQITNMDADEERVQAFGSHIGTDLSLEALTAVAERRHRGGVSDAVWGPDGRLIYFVHAGDLHSVDVESGSIEQLTKGALSASMPAISPDGAWLSFLRAGDLWLLNLETAHLVQATRVGEPTVASIPIGRFYAPDVEYASHRWSADSRYIALHYVDRRNVRKMPVPSYFGDEPFLNEVRRAYPGDSDQIQKVGIYRLEDGVVRYLDLDEPTNRNVLDLEWSTRDAKLLIQQDSAEGEHRWIYVATPDGAIDEVLHDHRPRRIYSVFTAAWSGDGREILYIDDNAGFYRLNSVAVSGGKTERLTRGDYDVAGTSSASPLIVVPGTGDIFFTSTEHSPYERHVYRISAGGGNTRKITSMPGVHEQLAVSPDGNYVAVVSSNDLRPMELYIKQVRSESPEQRITHSPPAEFYEYEWVEPRYVTFPSRIDSFTLHARVVEPPNLDRNRKYPVIIGNVYSNSVRNAWSAPRQISALQQTMAIDGEYIVVQPDLRGSIGYGVDFREAFQGDWGGGDLEDLHSLVEWLNTLPYVDSDRIGIWGNSYGGMMVLFALFEKPDLFAAGVSGAPAIDVHRFTGNDQHLSRRPQTHPEIFRDSTLLNYGEKLQDPLLFIHGLHDDIVPFRTSLQMMEKLLLLGKDFDVAIMPKSEHWWAYPEHYTVYTFRKLMQFFDRHLKPGQPQERRERRTGKPEAD